MKRMIFVLLALVLALSFLSVVGLTPAAAQGATPMVAAGYYHTVGLRSDGTVVAVGWNCCGECDVAGWSGIQQVAAGGFHTVGLRSDGTVVAVGYNDCGEIDVADWTGIQQVAAGTVHTVGLRSDGTVVAAGYNYYGECDVADWTGIQQVAAGEYHTVGLRSDGTVVAVGWCCCGACDVAGWSGIQQVAAGTVHTVGLRSDGTVVAVGYNYGGVCDVGGWSGIQQVASGTIHTVGLRSNGTVVAVGWNDYGECDVADWTGIQQVASGYYHTVGLRSDGTVVAVGYNFHGQCNVFGWDLGELAAFIATITFVSGEVSVKSISGEVQPFDKIQQNDEVITGHDGVLVVKDFGNEELIAMGANSKVKMSQTGNKTNLNLFSGRIRIKLKKLSPAELEIRTPVLGVIGVKGTEVLVDTTSEETVVTVLEGTADVSTADLSETTLLAENYSIVIDNQGLGEPFPIDPANVDRWWPEQVLVSVASPVNLCVTDPLGRRTGTDSTGQVLNEIPSAWYTGPDAVPEEMVIENPMRGNYQCDLYATGDGAYQLDTIIDLHDQSSFDRVTGDVYAGQVIQEQVQLFLTVEIDIKPGSYPNSINLKSKGVIPVAVLSTEDFDAYHVDPDTVVFADAEPVRWTMEDVDYDGDFDMLFHFRTQELNLTQESSEATLSGLTTGGTEFEGNDTVNIVPK